MLKIYSEETGGSAAHDHERIVHAEDVECGYRAIIAVHSTALGPALGGTRLWNYASLEDARTDALRLARGMTYKNALAGLPFGGGKSVLVGDAREIDRERVFRAHGRAVESLGGSYITAEDVNTSPADMEIMLRETRYVAGLIGRSGDPSPVTARGVFRAIQASAKYRWGSDSLAGRAVALQGCGHVGHHLARELAAAGARLLITDVDEAKARRVAGELGARYVEPAEIYDAPAEVFAPCALGGVVNDETLPRFKFEIVAGAANNQLLEARHGDALQARGVTYAPDYVANAGGVINGTIELLGWTPERARAKVEAIYDTLLEIFRAAAATGITPARAADELAEARIEAARGARTSATD
ncbi:MAG: leucine dehydrogenase [Acidobacteria bacterium]|nr:leucine dehydrogenase [Acidobacteriota bacterium]